MSELKYDAVNVQIHMYVCISMGGNVTTGRRGGGHDKFFWIEKGHSNSQIINSTKTAILFSLLRSESSCTLHLIHLNMYWSMLYGLSRPEIQLTLIMHLSMLFLFFHFLQLLTCKY